VVRRLYGLSADFRLVPEGKVRFFERDSAFLTFQGSEGPCPGAFAGVGSTMLWSAYVPAAVVRWYKVSAVDRRQPLAERSTRNR